MLVISILYYYVNSNKMCLEIVMVTYKMKRFWYLVKIRIIFYFSRALLISVGENYDFDVKPKKF